MTSEDFFLLLSYYELLWYGKDLREILQNMSFTEKRKSYRSGLTWGQAPIFTSKWRAQNVLLTLFVKSLNTGGKCLRAASFTACKNIWFQKKWLHVVPDAVKNVSIWIDPEHDVFHGGVVNERTLGVNEEDVWHPDLFHQPSIKCSAFVIAGGEGQSVVLPVMSKVQGHGEVLCPHKDMKNILSVCINHSFRISMTLCIYDYACWHTFGFTT